ncbi:MAG: ThuA domain-containing protein [Cyclobacteriaceae bacterium]|nr:ThuA domain-containing protein [Cyclobacteriaceae bacterium]
MKSYLAIAIIFILFISCEHQKPKVLVFSKTSGYRHASIGVGKTMLMELGRTNGFEVDTTEDASFFQEEKLKQYHAVIFLSTTLNVLDPVQQGDFKRFIQAGGGFVGIHAAADTEYEWPWYGKLVGAYFKSHPKTQQAKFVKTGQHELTAGLPDEWVRTDELYNYKNISDKINVLYTLDETSYEGGENGSNHPIAWYHEFDGGRSFYTGLGHTEESYADPLFRDHVLKGIQYAIGNNSKLDYSKVKAKRVPEDNRFTKTVLDFNLDEPTEMTMLPDGRIIFLERKGTVKLYDPKDGKVSLINTFNIGTKFEDGMIGLAADPNFEQNNWLYIFYSHPERSANIVSRFTFTDGKIDMASEKEIIEVPTQRETCCHTGGSLLFDPKGNLFISTGDNTSPFESDGFSPSDERPGRSPFDAQKSSANTNDLRGKILRIHPEPDGTYTIPEGNLFPKGEPLTRPEIYVMGNRNPYRISYDEKTDYLYWGEVGPDAGNNDSIRGPRGYDEINQARKAGFFGWPYFVGKNYAYAHYDFATKKIIGPWNPDKPINQSRNNTGKRELPSVAPPFIWYPYDKSDEFPMVKTGGRNAMAGPVYYSEKYKGVTTAFPDYFDGKLLIYDWMRNWMFLVTMDDQGDILDIEPFMENIAFNNIIDMTYGPDGKLYLLEYGTRWFKQNLDARLVRIDYNGGNRSPVANLSADKVSGAVPLTVNFSANGSMDYDLSDKLTYTLEAAAKTYTIENGSSTITFDKPGVYKAVLTVTDDKGASGSAAVQIIAGNDPPVVEASLVDGNTSFFFPGTPIHYAIKISDKEDGSTVDGKIGSQDALITFEYLKGFDMTQIAQGHQMPSAELPGKALMDKSDCKSCHLMNERSAGPGYKEIADKYKSDPGAIDLLSAKIIKGGAGVWGTTEMAAHPQISVEDARKMVSYILTLNEQKVVKRLPLSGTVLAENKSEGVYVLTASYSDKSVNNLPSLSSIGSVVLRAPVLNVNQISAYHRARKAEAPNGAAYVDEIKNGSHIMFKNIDLTNIKTVMPMAGKYGDVAGGSLELRLDSPEGKLIGSYDFKNASRTMVMEGVELLTGQLKIESVTGIHDLFVVFKNPEAGDKVLYFFTQLGLSNK